MNRATLQRRISTPIPQNASIRLNRAIIQLSSNVRIILGRDAIDNSLANGKAKTRYNYNFSTHRIIRALRRRVRGNGLVNISPNYTITIRTFYKRRSDNSSTSIYGRGTTPTDVSTGNTTLRFHEGSHGTDYIDYIRTNPLPAFNMYDGQDIEAEFSRLNQAIQRYFRDMENNNILNVDCVGTLPSSDIGIKCPTPPQSTEPTRQRQQPIE